jgi:hypothetical protein
MGNGEPGLIEIKTTKNFSVIKEVNEGVIPLLYETQMRFYMEVMNINHGFLLLAKRDESYKQNIAPALALLHIERDKKKGTKILKKCEEFIKTVTDGKEPNILDDEPKLARKNLESFSKKTEVDKKTAFTSFEVYNDKKEQIATLKKQIKDLESDIMEAENHIIKSLNLTDNHSEEIDKDNGLMYSFAYGIRQSFDKELCKKDYPEVFEKVYHPMKTKTKIFKIKKLKK